MTQLSEERAAEYRRMIQPHPGMATLEEIVEWERLPIYVDQADLLALLAALEEAQRPKMLADFMFENKVWAVPESYGWRLRIGQGGCNVEYEFESLYEHNGFPGAFADPFAAIDEYRKWKAARQALSGASQP